MSHFPISHVGGVVPEEGFRDEKEGGVVGGVDDDIGRLSLKDGIERAESQMDVRVRLCRFLL